MIRGTGRRRVRKIIKKKEKGENGRIRKEKRKIRSRRRKKGKVAMEVKGRKGKKRQIIYGKSTMWKGKKERARSPKGRGPEVSRRLGPPPPPKRRMSTEEPALQGDVFLAGPSRSTFEPGGIRTKGLALANAQILAEQLASHDEAGTSGAFRGGKRTSQVGGYSPRVHRSRCRSGHPEGLHAFGPGATPREVLGCGQSLALGR